MTGDAATPGDAPFAGEARHLLLEGLVACFDRVVALGQPLWVSLEAPSGWGKTRVVRELYARLAATRQPAPAYWPADLVDPHEDLSSRRKRTSPRVVHEPGSIPEWLWWGITCSSRNGVASVALAQDVTELEAHAPYLELRLRRGDLATRVGQAAAGASRAAADYLVGNVAESFVPGFDIVKQLAQFSWGALRAAQDRRELLGSDAAIAADHGELIAGVAATITRLAEAGVPVVVFVEDWHAADGSLAALLGRLVSARGPILIVTTAWPGHIEAKPHVIDALTIESDRVIRVDEESARLPSPFARGAGLGELEPKALAGIVRHVYPDVDAATASAIAARYPNPYAVELFCSLTRIRMRAARGPLTMTTAELEAFPAGVTDLYRQLWKELPESARIALALATLGIPRELDSALGSSTLWNTAMLADVVDDVGLPGADDVQEALATAPTAYAWARVVSDTLHRFVEPDQLAVAREYRDDVFGDEWRGDILDRLAARAAAELIEPGADLGPDRLDHTARLLLALHAEGFVTEGRTVTLAVLRLLRSLDGLSAEWPERERLARYAMAADMRVSVEGLEIRRMLGHVLRATDRLDEALDLLEDAVAKTASQLDADDEEVMRTRFELAAILSTLERHDDALAASRALLAQQEAVLGATHPETFRTRNLIAVDVDNLDGTAAAMAEYRALAEDREAAWGREDRGTLSSWANLAWGHGYLNHYDEALRLFEDVHERQIAALGPDDEDTLRTAYNIARMLRTSGRDNDALDRINDLVVRIPTVLGEAHALTAMIYEESAEFAESVNQFDPALVLRRGLVEMRTSSLGSEHRLTLRAEEALAHTLAAAGDAAEADALRDDIAARRREHLGHDDPDTLSSQRGRILRVGGPTSITDLDALAARVDSLLEAGGGGRRSALLWLREQLADDRIAALRVADRGDAAAALASDEIERRGTRLTAWSELSLRHQREAALIAHRTAEESATAFAALAAEAARRLGDPHPVTLWIRFDWAERLTASGQHAAAREVLEETLRTVDAHALPGRPLVFVVQLHLSNALSAADTEEAAARRDVVLGLAAARVESLEWPSVDGLVLATQHVARLIERDEVAEALLCAVGLLPRLEGRLEEGDAGLDLIRLLVGLFEQESDAQEPDARETDDDAPSPDEESGPAAV